MTGTTLLHYRIVGRLGKGGMGEVYAAEDTTLQRRVALKLLPPDVATDPERLQRFQREARAIAALNHPNVVTIYSVEEAGGVQFLTMELVEGKTLGDLIPPDGEWVVFYSQDQPEGDVYVSRPDRTGFRQLTRDEVVKDRVPRWSPDKTWVAFFSDRSKQAAVFDANRRWDEQKPDRLALPDKAIAPFIPNDWSPDHAKLVGMVKFTDRIGNGIVLYTFATRTYERLTDYGEWPAWYGTDNHRIFFVNRGKEFWLYDTRTKQGQKIYSTTWDVLGPPRLTRDGRKVFFSRRVTEGDIYLLSFE